MTGAGVFAIICRSRKSESRQGTKGPLIAMIEHKSELVPDPPFGVLITLGGG